MKSATKPNPAWKTAALASVLLAGWLSNTAAHAGPSVAADNASSSARSDSGVLLRYNIGVGQSVIVDLPRDAAEVLVGDPKTADAVVRSSRRLYIIAKASGQTTIYAMDSQNRRIASIAVSIGSNDGSELQNILKTAIPTGNIVVRVVKGAVILTGEVDSAEDAKKAYDIATGFTSPDSSGGGGGGDSSGGGPSSAPTPGGGTNSQYSSTVNFAPSVQKGSQVINSLTIRGKDQVMLKVTVAEVQRQVMKQLGITSSTVSGNWGTFTQDNRLPLNLEALTSGATTFGKGSIQATLTALERDDVARVLAEPTVTAVSGESAKFLAGGKIPVPQSETCPPSGTAGQCIINLTYENYGVSLNFTPIVLSAGDIMLHVSTEVTEIDPQKNFQLQGINVPGFRTRTNETSVELPSGGSIVSAGLLQVQSEQVINGFPGLMNLPILGQLFRSRDYQRQETELMIIVTPYLAKPVVASQLPLPTDGFADASDPQTALLGRINRIYASPNNPDLLRNYKGRVGFIND